MATIYTLSREGIWWTIRHDGRCVCEWYTEQQAREWAAKCGLVLERIDDRDNDVIDDVIDLDRIEEGLDADDCGPVIDLTDPRIVPPGWERI